MKVKLINLLLRHVVHSAYRPYTKMGISQFFCDHVVNRVHAINNVNNDIVDFPMGNQMRKIGTLTEKRESLLATRVPG